MTSPISDEDIAWSQHYIEYGNDRLKDIVGSLIENYNATKDMEGALKTCDSVIGNLLDQNTLNAEQAETIEWLHNLVNSTLDAPTTNKGDG